MYEALPEGERANAKNGPGLERAWRKLTDMPFNVFGHAVSNENPFRRLHGINYLDALQILDEQAISTICATIYTHRHPGPRVEK